MNPPAFALFEQIQIVMLTMSLDMSLTSLNPAAERLFARPASELLGRAFTTVLDPYSHAKGVLMLERTLADGCVTEWELDHIQPHGPPVLVGYTTTVLRNEAGEAIGLGAVGHDLTAKMELTAKLAETNQQFEGALLQLEKAHSQLKAAQTQLVQSEKMRSLGQMVAGVAHEINNPAGFVANNLTDLARRTPRLRALFDAYAPLKSNADSSQRAAIEQAETAAEIEYLWQDLPDLVKESQDGIERIRQIVLALRNFARLDEAVLKVSDINEGLRNTLRIIRPQCKDRITITEELGELPKTLCYPGELNQVFLNLLINAVQAIEGQGRIWVTSQYRHNVITVSIRDDGKGMDAVTLARLGEPFFTTKAVGSGTGLGLAICYGIVERHGGQLRFESASGRGTTAAVEIPVPV